MHKCISKPLVLTAVISQASMQDLMQSNNELAVMQFLQQQHAVSQLSTNQLAPTDKSHSTYEISATGHIDNLFPRWLAVYKLPHPQSPQQLLLLVV